MAFKDLGFLSPDIQSWIKEHREEFAEAFELADAMNRAGVRALLTSDPKQGNNQHLMVTLLFARILSHYQAAIILIERGATVSAKALLRVMLEATFLLGACVKDAAFLERFVKDDRKRQADMIEALLGIPPEQNAVPPAELEELRKQAADLRVEIKTDKLPTINAFDAAQRAGLLDYYRLFYVPYCNTVHSSVRDFASYIVEDAQGEIQSLKWGPQSADVEDLVDAAIQIFFAAAHTALKTFPRPEIDAEFERIWKLHSTRVAKKTEELKKSESA